MTYFQYPLDRLYLLDKYDIGLSREGRYARQGATHVSNHSDSKVLLDTRC